jgi:hypothetical protein
LQELKLEILRYPDVGKPFAPGEGILVIHAQRYGERFLHSQRPQEVQRRRKRGHEAQRRWCIETYITAEKPEGVPEENWLPIPREDLDLSPQMRVYVPDMEKMKTWTAPKAEKR